MKVGADGYTSAGSTFFYSGPYYTQIVTTKDDAAFADFALKLAHRIAAAQKPEAPAGAANDGSSPKTAVAGGTPEALFALLPDVSGKTSPTYVPADVFGYAFLSEVFMAEYNDGKATWKGFVRPYADAAEAKAVFEKSLAGAKQDGRDQGREGRRRGSVRPRVEHRPHRHHLPQRQHPRRRGRRDRPQSRHRVRPRLH